MQPIGGMRFRCGVISLATDRLEDSKFWNDLAAAHASGRYGFGLVFFSQTHFTPEDIRDGLARNAPTLQYAACSTAGEIGGAEVTFGGLVAILFPRDEFSFSTVRIPDLRTIGFDRIVSLVTEAKKKFLQEAGTSATQSRSGSTETFALSLIDGLSVAEETVTAAFHWALEEIPLLGGSAGDDMRFAETSLILNGEIGNDCALLILVRTEVPFRIFKTDNFVPTDRKLVVTKSDPERRIIHEFNAAEAASEYARVIGMPPGELSPMSFASHPLVVRVGGEYYCRSVQKVNPDGSLSFFCAIDDGIVLTVAEPEGMTRTTKVAFDAVREDLGDIDFVLGFDCVLRRIDAQNRQATQRIQSLYRENNVIGFNTYGEQYHSMHLNQTFTGIAFGPAVESGDPHEPGRD
ncbi:FIST N-terminal domain-containing protein [Roseibium sediminis]|uniref:FIST N-terminal domain-containing protein n=1 Tax=Roseibium sediminis TaxID=1775174 RepID=UPI00123D5089|nr:FIST N-terminal domain-containing protein [Roseibium sediminis]